MKRSRNRRTNRNKSKRIMRGGMCPPCIAAGAGIGVGKYMIGAAGAAGIGAKIVAAKTNISKRRNRGLCKKKNSFQKKKRKGGGSRKRKTQRKTKLHGIVQELFQTDKKKYKLSRIHYGKKALGKYADVAFKDRDEMKKKKYIKKWDKTKLSNSVYFVHQSRKGLSHRFISNASKEGGHSYLGHLERR